jgi:general transcription factor 3C polypeptide 3 (transcription factor C subunit 4)
LLSESESSAGSSSEDDESSSEASGSGSDEASSGSGEEDNDSSSEEEDSQSERAGPSATGAKAILGAAPGQLTAAQKGKGRERQDTSGSGSLLPPLPTTQTDAESDYATDAGDLRRKLPDEELGRLISAIRNDSVEPIGSGSRGLLGQEWDKTMQQEMDEMDQEEEMSRAPTGQRRKPRRGRGRVAIGDQEPSPEIKAMLGSANLAYIHGNTKEAIDTLTEIIRIDPSTKAAWYTLSTIHDEQGNHDKALQLRIVPAHLSKSNPETWKELGSQSKDLGLLEQAVYCYTQALRADRHNVEAIWDRSILLRTTGKTRQAIMGFNNLLKLQPHNPNVLRELGPLYFQLKEIDAATSIYMAAYEHFRTKVPVPKTPAQIQGFGTDELEMLSDFLRSQRRYREAGRVITDGQRWLQGRIKEEGTWASFGDDREYDLQRKVRDGWAEHPQRWCEEAPTHSLVTGLRLRLGLCRLCEGKPEEARVRRL